LFLIRTGKDGVGQNFTTFSGPEHNGEGKVENGVQINRLSARNVPTLFRVQFLSFPVSTTKKCFDRILTTFSGLGTAGPAKVENRTEMIMFGTPNIPTQFVVQFLSFPVGTVKK